MDFVHTNLHKNNRQPYAVRDLPGHLSSAEFWCAGRPVAQFPEFEVVRLIGLARVLLETCVVGDLGLHQQKPGVIGTTW